MLRTTFAQIPIELEEAARVDGCSRLKAFFLVTLPLAKVGYIVVGTLCFLLAYGEFVYPVSLVNKNELQPATVGLYGFVGADYSDWSNAHGVRQRLRHPRHRHLRPAAAGASSAASRPAR